MFEALGPIRFHTYIVPQAAILRLAAYRLRTILAVYGHGYRIGDG